MLQECGSWAPRNGAVQMFFLTPTRNMFAGKFAKSERRLCSRKSENLKKKALMIFTGTCGRI